MEMVIFVEVPEKIVLMFHSTLAWLVDWTLYQPWHGQWSGFYQQVGNREQEFQGSLNSGKKNIEMKKKKRKEKKYKEEEEGCVIFSFLPQRNS